jgi:HlyD family secretion protein
MSVHSLNPRPVPMTAEQAIEAQFAPRPVFRKRYWIAGAAVIALLVAGGVYWSGRKPPVASPAPSAGSVLTVTTAKAQIVEMPQTLLVTGSLAGWDELPIGTSTSGLAIVEVAVDEGDRVVAGQLLARFDDSVLKATLAQTEAALREAEAIAAEASTNVRRAEELARTGTVSSRELDARRATAATAQARVGVAAANRDQALARLKQTEVRAPTDGSILRRNARLGAVMASGGTELFRLLRDDRIELVAEVPELDLAALAVGQTVTLLTENRADDAASPDISGTVRMIAPIVDPKTRLGIVKIAVPAQAALRSGMFVTAQVETSRRQVLAVPESAVVYKDAKPLVFSVKPAAETDGAARTVVQANKVETGARSSGWIAISSALKPGDAVVLAGAGYLKDGDSVKVQDTPPDVPLRPLPQAN